MYCPTCGSTLLRQMKYCTHCGEPLNKRIEQAEERFDEYLDGLFWVAVFGLGSILGGAFFLTKVLDVSNELIIAYMVLSSAAFLIIFGLSLWQTLRLARGLKKADVEALTAARDTNKLRPAEEPMPRELTQSVTEDTTRTFEPISKVYAPK
jgi:uncharacterized membrane protein YvbJ